MDVCVLRRNRQIVPWRREKIAIAVGKAFLAAGRSTELAADIAERVEKKIFTRGLATVDIESIQDAVQGELLAIGEKAIAESYANYRHGRAAERERQKFLKNLPQQAITFVRMPDGNVRCWTDDLWMERLRAAADGLALGEDLQRTLRELRRAIPDEVTWKELRRFSLANVLHRATVDPIFSHLAARMDLQFLREDVLGPSDPVADEKTLRRQRRQAFPAHIREAVERHLLDERMGHFFDDLPALADALDGTFDMALDWPAMELLRGELLLTGKDMAPLETPQFFWMRVAMGILLNSDRSVGNVVELYGALARRKFCPASTTLLHAGTPHPQLLPSYVYELQDSMEDIMVRGIAENAFAARWGAGLGGSWTAIRGEGAAIGGTGGISSGVRPFLELHRHQLALAHQGPHRRAGAGCAYLDIWHWDVPMFLRLWKEMADGCAPLRSPELQTCLWIPDVFMERLDRPGSSWTFFQPGDVFELLPLSGLTFADRYRAYEAAAADGRMEAKTVSIQEFWQQLLANIFETGYPRLAFSDTFQRNNLGPSSRPIRASSLFGESAMAMGPDEKAGAAFGTISLPAHRSSDGTFYWEDFRRTIRLAVRTLDSILSVTNFPAAGIARHCERHRGLALGLAGLHDLLRGWGIPFASEGAERCTAEICACLCHGAILASTELAGERGTCPAFSESNWAHGLLPAAAAEANSVPSQDWNKLRNAIQTNGMRNAYLIAHAPTSRTSRLLGVSASVLPIESNVHRIALPDGERVWILDAALAMALKSAGIWSADMGERLRFLDGDLTAFPAVPEKLATTFSTAFSIPGERALAMAACVQSWTDQSQFLPLRLRMPTFSLLSQLLQLAWRMGIKVVGQLVTSHALVENRTRENFLDA
ncbi:MAG: ribonucleoside-diphosphate reductase subunit alpha [Puniceicoccales bacterium]|nr:ribonucleoside-diphosphate reductase subunit alpha [Puniceicoccales bacterium]